MILRIVDLDGRFLRDDFVFDPETEQGIETPCPEGFSWPKWDGEQWVEGGGVFEAREVSNENTEG